MHTVQVKYYTQNDVFTIHIEIFISSNQNNNHTSTRFHSY